MALQDTKLRQLKPSGKLQRLTDGRGLTFEMRPTGRKFWRFRYRFNGKPNMLTLGEYPNVSLSHARKLADGARGKLSKDIDPGAEKRDEKLAKTVEAEAATIAESHKFDTVATEWFEKFGGELSDSHLKRQKRRLEKHVSPWLGKTQISEITPRQLLEVLERVVDSGAVETAHRIKTLCGQVFRYAIVTERADRDITQDLKGALPAPRKGHFAAVTEVDDIGPLLKAVHSYSGTLPVKCALKLAPLVFCRPGELRKAEWSDIDLDKAEWRFDASKTHQNHIVPLSTQAVAILQELHPLTGDGRFVFRGARSTPGKHEKSMSENTVNSALRGADIPQDKMCGHGFRAMARTVLDEVLNFPPDIIDHQLAHAVKDPNGRAYNRTKYLPQRKKMMQAWSDYLEGLRHG